MALEMQLSYKTEDGQDWQETFQFSDSPFLESAITRARELIMDHATWGVPVDSKWKEVSIKLVINRK